MMLSLYIEGKPANPLPYRFHALFIAVTENSLEPESVTMPCPARAYICDFF